MNNECKIPPFRPICSSINSYNYKLAKHLSDLLKSVIPQEHSVQDTFCFVKELQQLKYNDEFLCSYDVSSLFTNIPLKETIGIAVDKIFEKNADLKINKQELTKLFLTCTAENHFYFDGKVFDQCDGVSMGSPLAPGLANLFLGYHENRWIEENKNNVLFYKRYVDDIFCLLKSETDADDFLTYLNRQHPNIKFTLEKQKENKLAFLDVSINKTHLGLNTSVFKKQVDTGLLTNFLVIPGLNTRLA